MPARRLAIVLSTEPSRRDMVPASRLAHAARSAGVEVQFFFMHEGVAAATEHLDIVERLFDDGCDLIACTSSAERYGTLPLPPSVTLGSQDDHASVVRRADRVVAFT